MNSKQPETGSRKFSALPLILLAVAAIAGAALFLARPASDIPKGNLAGSAVGGPFTLTDETGAKVTSDSYKGLWRLMYFGFTYCPDVCPTDTAKLAAGLKLFEQKNPAAAAKVQPLFITVDPERDTPAALAEFTDQFHPRLVGLTGTRPEIDSVLKEYHVYASKVPGTVPDAYTFDHLAIIYLMDPEGRPVEFVAGSTATPQTIADMLERFVG